MNFLDLTVFIFEQDWTMRVKGRLNLRLNTKVYQKPMNLYQYVHWNSNHSRRIYFAIIKGEIVRYLRICSRREDFEVLKSLFSDRLKRRGFPVNVIKDAFRRSPDYTKRYRYLEPSPKKREKGSKLRLFKQFEQNFDVDSSLEQILKRHWAKSPRGIRTYSPEIVNKSKRNLCKGYFR